MLRRPDARCLLVLRDCAPQAYGPLLDAALDAVDQDLYVDVEENADDLQRELVGRGFTGIDPGFDPATYLLAVDTVTDGYAGLVRVWAAGSRPRLGLVATVRAYRRRGLATALLARAFAVLHARGQPAVTCEVDQANTASTALLTGLGARRTGGGVELVRRRPPP
ncbi:MAG TPA: GNAT family N-acetyltransferase [Micromonosporaceae bacterium]|nr:GNAT family N-acetyltransferase [Micromonosporaceae bacterium]